MCVCVHREKQKRGSLRSGTPPPPGEAERVRVPGQEGWGGVRGGVGVAHARDARAAVRIGPDAPDASEGFVPLRLFSALVGIAHCRLGRLRVGRICGARAALEVEHIHMCVHLARAPGPQVAPLGQSSTSATARPSFHTPRWGGRGMRSLLRCGRAHSEPPSARACARNARCRHRLRRWHLGGHPTRMEQDVSSLPPLFTSKQSVYT